MRQCMRRASIGRRMNSALHLWCTARGGGLNAADSERSGGDNHETDDVSAPVVDAARRVREPSPAPHPRGAARSHPRDGARTCAAVHRHRRALGRQYRQGRESACGDRARNCRATLAGLRPAGGGGREQRAFSRALLRFSRSHDLHQGPFRHRRRQDRGRGAAAHRQIYLRLPGGGDRKLLSLGAVAVDAGLPAPLILRPLVALSPFLALSSTSLLEVRSVRMKRRLTWTAWGVVMLRLLAACAAGPKFDASGVDKTLTPPRAAAEIRPARGNHMIWGGAVLASSHTKVSTQFEVRAYPLNCRFRPDSDAAPLGRFLIIKQGYIETADFSAGRSLSVRGTLQREQSGQIGDVVYTYPVLEPIDIFLWPRGESSGGSIVHFGFGVSIIR